MSDCVFSAWEQACYELGVPATSQAESNREYRIYKGIKLRWQADADGYTKMALVPHIIRTLAARKGLIVKVQHRLFTPLAARQEAFQEHNWRTLIASYRWPDWGEYVEELTLKDAIYLMVTPIQHAYWGIRPRKQAGHYMALRVDTL